MLINKKKRRTCHLVDFAVPPDHRVKIRKARQIPRSCQKAEKAVKHEGDCDTNYTWSPWNSLQRLGKVTEDQKKESR